MLTPCGRTGELQENYTTGDQLNQTLTLLGDIMISCIVAGTCGQGTFYQHGFVITTTQVMTAERFVVLVRSRWKPTAVVTVATVYQSHIYVVSGTVELLSNRICSHILHLKIKYLKYLQLFQQHLLHAVCVLVVDGDNFQHHGIV